MIEIIDRDETFERDILGARMRLRRLPRELVRELRKKHTRHRTEWVNHQPMRVTEVDEDAVNDDLVDYLIVGWGDQVRHPVTKLPVPCTREMKLALPGKVLALVLFEAEQASLDGAAAGGGEDDDLGNSSSSSSSAATAPA